MPGIEVQRAPFGANLGSSVNEWARDLSTRIKERIHEKYKDPIPPYSPTNKQWEDCFASIGFKRGTIEKLWRLFCLISNCTDRIGIEHFLTYFNLDWTPCTERCFQYFDATGSGHLDFLEFVLCVWGICTFKVDTLSNFAFGMYDLDSDGELSLPEIERMVHELFGVGGGKRCLKEAIDFAQARGGVLSL
jgi:hypothetical protein